MPTIIPLAIAPSRQPMFSHTPERSGLPSSLGTGPVMTTLPSAVLGAPGVGVFCHCACTATPETRQRAAIQIFIDCPIYCPLGAGFDRYAFDAASSLIGVTLSGSILTIR